MQKQLQQPTELERDLDFAIAQVKDYAHERNNAQTNETRQFYNSLLRSASARVVEYLLKIQSEETNNVNSN